jgi:DEAD/DEAH box helicase domain-containing protein
MSLMKLLAHWKSDPQVGSNLVEWRVLPAKQANTVPFPADIHPILQGVIQARGIHSLYTHQASAFNKVKEGKNIVIVTGTASGKTLCYNLPVLDRLLKEKLSTALYLFPTKALSQDQNTVLKSLLLQIDSKLEETHAAEQTDGIGCAIYDGDTPVNIRSTIRKTARLIITNPDMLHTGILPHHTGWAEFFKGLRFVIIGGVWLACSQCDQAVTPDCQILRRYAPIYPYLSHDRQPPRPWRAHDQCSRDADR